MLYTVSEKSGFIDSNNSSADLSHLCVVKLLRFLAIVICYVMFVFTRDISVCVRV